MVFLTGQTVWLFGSMLVQYAVIGVWADHLNRKMLLADVISVELILIGTGVIMFVVIAVGYEFPMKLITCFMRV